MFSFTKRTEILVELRHSVCLFRAQSEDSMEHLSAEERACLMYLEETIEALEVQEDSGLSNDEPDPGAQAQRIAWRVNGTLLFCIKSVRVVVTFDASRDGYSVAVPVKCLL